MSMVKIAGSGRVAGLGLGVLVGLTGLAEAGTERAAQPCAAQTWPNIARECLRSATGTPERVGAVRVIDVRGVRVADMPASDARPTRR